MNTLTGTFDNRTTMRREHWFNGQMTASWSMHFVDTEVKRDYAHCKVNPWGHFPDLPSVK